MNKLKTQKWIKPSIYFFEKDTTWYSPITKKCYDSQKELNQDIRKIKLKKIRTLNELFRTC